MQTTSSTRTPGGAVRLIRRITTGWALLGGAALLTIVMVTSVNSALFAVDRVGGLFDLSVRGLPGYEDFVLLVIGGTALSFFPYCQMTHHHLGVTLFSNRFPAVLNRWLDRTWLVLTFALAAFLAYWMFAGLMERYQDRAISRVLGWPEWPFMIPAIVSLLLWSAVAAMQFFVPSPDRGAAEFEEIA